MEEFSGEGNEGTDMRGPKRGWSDRRTQIRGNGQEEVPGHRISTSPELCQKSGEEKR